MDHGKILVNDTSAELKKLIPGGTVLEVRVCAPTPEDGPVVRERILAGLKALPGASKVDAVDAVADGETEPGSLTFRLYAEAANALIGPAAQTALAAGAQVRDLSVKQPTLEEVFIFLTGRHLR
jgi:ABC-2 type transport system ATP-binding protein